jgi:hypothetical protein
LFMCVKFFEGASGTEYILSPEAPSKKLLTNKMADSLARHLISLDTDLARDRLNLCMWVCSLLKGVMYEDSVLEFGRCRDGLG